MKKLLRLRLHKEDILTKQLCRLTTNQEFLEDALQRAKSSIQSSSDVQFLLSRPNIVSTLETEENYSVVLEPEAQFLPEFTMEEKDKKVRIHLHLPYYKHSLSTRPICSDLVRFVKVLNVPAHRPKKPANSRTLGCNLF